MKTNLIFKRTVTTQGITQTEMKAVEVDIPEISSKDGWELCCTADKVTIYKKGQKEYAESHYRSE